MVLPQTKYIVIQTNVTTYDFIQKALLFTEKQIKLYSLGTSQQPSLLCSDSFQHPSQVTGSHVNSGCATGLLFGMSETSRQNG